MMVNGSKAPSMVKEDYSMQMVKFMMGNFVQKFFSTHILQFMGVWNATRPWDFCIS